MLGNSRQCPSLTVPNLLMKWGRIDHLCLVGGSFLVILAMTMTMTFNSNSILLMRVTSAGLYESFEHVQKFRVPSANTFHSWLCALKTCGYLLCRTAYAPVSLCRMRMDSPFEFVWVIIPGHSSNDNYNDNRFEQCSSHACSLGRPARKFWRWPAWIIFIPAYAHWKRVVVVFVA